MTTKNEIKQVSDLGEFGLIKFLTDNIQLKNKQSVYGIGDDAAVLDYKNKKVIVTADILTEGVHFDLVYTPLKHLGYKAVVVNLSDIYAMNAIPKQIIVSIAFSSKFSVQALEQLYEGIKTACDMYNVDLVGGDTTSSVTGMVISITAVGEAENNKLCYRNGAKINDLICVTGNLGAAYMGLQLLEREKTVFTGNTNVQPQLDGYEYILERQLKPEARKDIISILGEKNIVPTSMIDISDGLSSELFHICTQSNVGCNIYEEKIPIDHNTFEMAEEMNMEPLIAALNGGEDYELLFTVPMSEYENISSLQKISVIGHITEQSQGLNLVTQDNRTIPLKARGWDSFDD